MKPFALLVLTVLFGIVGCPSAEAGWKDLFKSQEQKDAEIASGLANYYRQRTIEKYHLLAHAQSVEVLKYVWVDSEGNPVPSKSPQASILVVQYVIRWEGPLNKGGMTQMISAYDFKRPNIPVVQEVAVSTNGVLNADAARTAGALVGLLLQ